MADDIANQHDAFLKNTTNHEVKRVIGVNRDGGYSIKSVNGWLL